MVNIRYDVRCRRFYLIHIKVFYFPVISTAYIYSHFWSSFSQRVILAGNQRYSTPVRIYLSLHKNNNHGYAHHLVILIGKSTIFIAMRLPGFEPGLEAVSLFLVKLLPAKGRWEAPVI